MSTKKKKYKADIVLFIAVIAVCVLGLVIIRANQEPGLTARIMGDGKLITTIPLDDDRLYILECDTNGYTVRDISDNELDDLKKDGFGYNDTSDYYVNILSVDASGIEVLDANCRDKICVEHSIIYNTGETIICLPHKLVIEVAE